MVKSFARRSDRSHTAVRHGSLIESAPSWVASRCRRWSTPDLREHGSSHAPGGRSSPRSTPQHVLGELLGQPIRSREGPCSCASRTSSLAASSSAESLGSFLALMSPVSWSSRHLARRFSRRVGPETPLTHSPICSAFLAFCSAGRASGQGGRPTWLMTAAGRRYLTDRGHGC